ncbi:uncharacterized protein MONOS_5585 [Monocercomonoides exilis]|uniref:uncharacterized protein n=1 Tax=Monocercomonoides exilis TaxID=2049356 RepID=UPI00355AC44D|nr:hypothetical protein MONOS_5585 [Monocercomonoides exilis]|eukprot:MONOS_5585.1-p1 / transcript=MONOS_5585.1 / gene=MONOS_5585 / organism=Monocercomonoides_exilis_PA203 / gene_product=unspecified product / transcript_product=unspecified product / location=Mono_scaffold00164:75471-77870(+) / protein_length=800 / sequence_SO=supercontig / SO=protein_coding / is_pseudo=false
MSQLLQFANETKQPQKRNVTTKETLHIMKDFNEQFNKYESIKHLAILLGKSQTGKSTMIAALLGIPLKETREGKIVKVSELSIGPKIGNGRVAQTQLPTAYKLDDRVCLLDTRGFHGCNIDIETDILSTLILEVNLRKCSNVSVLYLTEFGNYFDFSKLEADMLLVNDICEDMNLPVLFVANKCKEPLKYELKANKEPEETQITEIEKSLHGQFMEMYKEQMYEIQNKYFKELNLSDPSAQSDEKTLKVIHEKIETATGLEQANLEKCLKQLKILTILRKALEEGRFIFNDPVNSFSVDRLRGILRDERYFVHSNRLSLGRCTPESSMFLNSVSEMAIKLSWLVEAMIGRMHFPKNLASTKEACESFIRMLEQDSSKLSGNEMKLYDDLRKLDVESPELVETRIENEENSIKEIEKLIKDNNDLISSLDTDESVLYEKYHFEKKDGFFSSEIVVEKPVKVPGSMFKFIPENELTHADEDKLKPKIENGWFRGAFKAEKGIKKIIEPSVSLITQLLTFNPIISAIGSIGTKVVGHALNYFMPDRACACEGTIEFYAQSGDIPSNKQKIEQYRIKIFEMVKQAEKVRKNIDFLNDTKKKINNTKTMLEEAEMMKAVWQKRVEKVEEILRFCDECDKKYKESRKLIDQLYFFAKHYLPQTFVNRFKAGKSIPSTLKSFLPSSSAVPSISSSFDVCQEKESSFSAESSFLPCVCECKANEDEEEEQDLPLEQQVDEDKKILARFMVALEKLEETHKQQNTISLEFAGKFDPKEVEKSIDEIGKIYHQTAGCIGYFEQFKKCIF